MNEKNKKNYIGLAITPHDPAISIVSPEGEILFAQAAERYLQNKRAWSSPPDDLFFIKKLIKEYCDPSLDLVLAFSWQRKYTKKIRHFLNNPIAKFLLQRRLGETFTYYFYSMRMIFSKFNEYSGINTEYWYRNLTGKNVYYQYYDHHLTHAAAACYSSKYKEALCVVVDGNGQDGALNFYRYQNGKIERINSNSDKMASLGFFYALVCTTCGFDEIAGEEWKVMGLAAYGKFNQEHYDLLKKLIKVEDINLKLVNKSREVIAYCQKIKRTTTPAIEFADFAFTGQYVFAELMNELLNNLYQKYPCENLILAGGCALNSSYIGTIRKNTPFKNSYVFCAPADDGNAVGTALLSYYEDHPYTPRKEIQLPYLGSKASSKSLEHVHRYSGLNIKTNCSPNEVIERIASEISAGKIVGWMQGRAEFGPRALGNRSILADPRNPDIKERLNAEVKFREEFRPFAPSILHEFGEEYFEDYQETPYMERTLLFKPSVRHKVPGVVHEDGSGRLQTVKREWNEKYYLLIKAFYEKTGIPILLNTSFNVMGKPIVHSVEDALSVFFTSGLDILVIENNIFMK